MTSLFDLMFCLIYLQVQMSIVTTLKMSIISRPDDVGNVHIGTSGWEW